MFIRFVCESFGLIVRCAFDNKRVKMVNGTNTYLLGCYCYCFKISLMGRCSYFPQQNRTEQWGIQRKVSVLYLSLLYSLLFSFPNNNPFLPSLIEMGKFDWNGTAHPSPGASHYSRRWSWTWIKVAWLTAGLTNLWAFHSTHTGGGIGGGFSVGHGVCRNRFK